MTPTERSVATAICTLYWGNATLAHPSPWTTEMGGPMAVEDEYPESEPCIECGEYPTSCRCDTLCVLCGQRPVAPWETQAGARNECKDCGAH